MAADHGEGGEGHDGDGNSIMEEGRSSDVSRRRRRAAGGVWS